MVWMSPKISMAPREIEVVRGLARHVVHMSCLVALLYTCMCVHSQPGLYAHTWACLYWEFMHDRASVSAVKWVCVYERERVRGMSVYLGWLRCGGTPHCRVWLPAKLLCYQGNMLQPGIRGEQPNLTVFGLFLSLGRALHGPQHRAPVLHSIGHTHTHI